MKKLIYIALGALGWYIYKSKLRKIKLVILDVDGVLTDRRLYYSESGEIYKSFDARDGLGIKLLQQHGIEIALVSGGKPGSVHHRSKDLGITRVHTCIANKKEFVSSLIKICGLNRHQALFVGDDLNDLEVKYAVSLLIAPIDAASTIIRHSHCVLFHAGGHGAVRELTERLLEAQSKVKPYHYNGWYSLN